MKFVVSSPQDKHRHWLTLSIATLLAIVIRALPWRNFLDHLVEYLFYGPRNRGAVQ
jgi:hypothetical protein